MNEVVLRLDGVHFGYRPDQPVLDGCTLELARGERVCLRGPNGSGKTTLLALVVGLVKPAAGRVEVLGAVRRTERDFREIRGRVGLLFQDSEDQLFCPTVAEDVAFGPLNRGLARHQVRDLVERTLACLGLEGYAQRITYQLSGGERRLVALATVLAMEPELLLLDEPTAGLDEATEARVTEVLLGLPQTMLIVTHDRQLARRLATRTVCLAQGRLEPVAEPPEQHPGDAQSPAGNPPPVLS